MERSTTPMMKTVLREMKSIRDVERTAKRPVIPNLKLVRESVAADAFAKMDLSE